MKRLITVLFLFVIFLTTSCANSKNFEIDGETVTVEPYGWFDLDAKNDSIEYKTNSSNIILCVIFSETIIVPIIISGEQLYEPVRKKK